jgi:outer membrane protein TolC
MQRLLKMAARIGLVLATLAVLLPPAAALAGEAQSPFKLDVSLADAAAAQAGPGSSSGVMPLSVKDSIALALKNNLDITIEGYNPQLRVQDLTFQKATFDPSAFFEGGYLNNRFPPAFDLIGGSTLLQDSTYNVGVRQTLPTGGTYEFRFNNQYYSTIQNIQTGFNSGLLLTLKQPLLRNFGFEANETGIRIAGNNESISREQLRLRVSSVVTQVQNAYAELVYAIENLKVQQRSLDLARDLMKLNQARVRAGVAAPVEVTQAQAQEAAQVQNVILAQKAVRDNEDALKVVMNIPATGSWGQEIQPTYTLSFEPKSFNLDETIQRALENRYEYKSAKLDIENKDLSARLTRNQLLPDLAFTGSVSTSGFGTGWGGDMGSVGGGNAVSYGLGVVLTVPLGNRAAQSNYIKAQLTADQAKTSLKQLEIQIVQQVREAVRRVEAFANRVSANYAARVLAEEQLRVETRRLEAGVSTTFNVLSFQRDLATAQANEVRAVADYYEALANLENVRGTVLETNKIEM